MGSERGPFSALSSGIDTMGVTIMAVYEVPDGQAAAALYHQSWELRRSSGQLAYRVFKVDSSATQGDQQVRGGGGEAELRGLSRNLLHGTRSAPPECRASPSSLQQMAIIGEWADMQTFELFRATPAFHHIMQTIGAPSGPSQVRLGRHQHARAGVPPVPAAAAPPAGVLQPPQHPPTSHARLQVMVLHEVTALPPPVTEEDSEAALQD